MLSIIADFIGLFSTFNTSDKEQIKTFICDNGKEFSGHEELSEILSASFYFANPYCS